MTKSHSTFKPDLIQLKGIQNSYRDLDIMNSINKHLYRLSLNNHFIKHTNTCDDLLGRLQEVVSEGSGERSLERSPVRLRSPVRSPVGSPVRLRSPRRSPSRDEGSKEEPSPWDPWDLQWLGPWRHVPEPLEGRPSQAWMRIDTRYPWCYTRVHQ